MLFCLKMQNILTNVFEHKKISQLLLLSFIPEQQRPAERSNGPPENQPMRCPRQPDSWRTRSPSPEYGRQTGGSHLDFPPHRRRTRQSEARAPPADQSPSARQSQRSRCASRRQSSWADRWRRRRGFEPGGWGGVGRPWPSPPRWPASRERGRGPEGRVCTKKFRFAFSCNFSWKLLTKIWANFREMFFARTKIITKSKILDSFYLCYLEIFDYYGLLLVWKVKLVTGNYFNFGNCIFLIFWVCSGTVPSNYIVTYMPLQKFPRRRKFSQKYYRKRKILRKHKFSVFRENFLQDESFRENFLENTRNFTNFCKKMPIFA